MTTPVPTIGVASATASIPERKDVRDVFKKDKVMWELFLLGLYKFQQDGAKDRSYFDIAGIHGEPYTAWNGVDRTVMGKKDSWSLRRAGSNYCSHSSALFATWHRPYLALFEQELHRHVLDEAKRLGGRYPEKASGFRLPYWDWAIKTTDPKEAYPVLFDDVSVVISIDNNLRIRNPLAAFRVDDLDGSAKREPTTLIPGKEYFPFTYDGKGTVRYPVTKGRVVVVSDGGAKTDSDGLRGAIHNLSVRSAISSLLGQVESNGRTPVPKYSFNAVSTNKLGDGGVGGFSSLEALHDTIHGTVSGAGGHMGQIGLAAFDPIFWLHHCNVDRLLAIYQALYPNSNLQEWKSSKVTLTTDKGDRQGSDTNLYPFRRSSGQPNKFWTSEDIKNTTALGYTYPETSERARQEHPNYFNWLLGEVSRLYGAPGLPSSKRVRAPDAVTSFMAFQAEPDLPLINPGPGNPSSGREAAGSQPGGGVPNSSAESGDLGGAGAITTTQSNVIDDDDDESTFTVWTANIRAEKHVLGQPYNVYLFLGEFPRSDPSAWDLNQTTVGLVAILGRPEDTGCDKCVADMADQLCVTGTVSLTEALLDSYNGTINADDSLTGFDDETVEEYLTKNLHWRVALGDNTEVPRDQVPGLVVCVSSVKMRMDGNGVPVFDSEHTVHPGITDGRPAGLREGDEI
ncbi:hypothetical protein B0H67DRAFT_647365 [Lasiosphaeris hirsuta]|uniref:tyrosinase n=1 Tax=Lasiosphaeris hirsuta TaxID=260670 RepID=A0AA40DQR4_9PEZI|nr:hypothetical protein B0H67DRAFT_647365 [Lasiosphaeris hirsuta]